MRDTLYKIIGKSSVSKEKDVAQNIYAFRFVLFCMVIASADRICIFANTKYMVKIYGGAYVLGYERENRYGIMVYEII